MFGSSIYAPKYICVDHKNSGALKGTEDINEAELFMMKVLDDSDSHNRLEFSITSSFPQYRKRSKKNNSQLPAQSSDGDVATAGSMSEDGGDYGMTSRPMEYYLETRVNTWGKGDIVRMRMNSRLKNVRLLLKQRINPSISCNTKQWRRQRESYYIQCVHWPRNGYLCVKKRQEEYQVCVRPSVDRHSEEDDVFMLFQLKSST